MILFMFFSGSLSVFVCCLQGSRLRWLVFCVSIGFELIYSSIIVISLLIMLMSMVSRVMVVSMCGVKDLCSISSDGRLMLGKVISNVMVGFMFMFSESMDCMMGILVVVGIMKSVLIIVSVMIYSRLLFMLVLICGNSYICVVFSVSIIMMQIGVVVQNSCYSLLFQWIRK